MARKDRWFFVQVGGTARDVTVWGPFETEALSNAVGNQGCPVTRIGHPGYYVTRSVPTRIEAEGRAAQARRELREKGYR